MVRPIAAPGSLPGKRDQCDEVAQTRREGTVRERGVIRGEHVDGQGSRDRVQEVAGHDVRCRAAPVLTDEGHVAQVQTADHTVQPVDVSGKGVVGGIGRLVGAAGADVVRRDHPQPGSGKDADHPSIQARPGRLPVHQHDHWTVGGACVHVVHPHGADSPRLDLQVVGGIRVVRQVLESVVGRSPD
jgi:hypothetical protein